MTLSIFGYRGYSANLMFNTIKKDILNKNISILKKIKLWRKGFSATRATIYNINPANCHLQMSDFDYFKLHPINGKYSRWIDDKLLIKYILSPFSEYLPKYFFQIREGEILKLPDCPNDITTDLEGITKLLKREKILALKKISGSLGKGFYKIKIDNGIVINDKTIISDNLNDFIKNLNEYLITEFLISHGKIRKIYSKTANTLRVLIIKDKNKKPQITGNFMRYGTKYSGLEENSAAGTIFAKVDIEKGIVIDPKRVINNKIERLEFHPDTKENLKIIIPYWKEIKEVLLNISEYIPQLEYMGFDIIITDNSFKIIEINSLSSLSFLPYYFPHFQDKYSKEFFIRKFKENPKKYKRILKILEKESKNKELFS